MEKQNLNKILNLPEFLGIQRESSKTYEMDLDRLMAEMKLSPEMEKERKKRVGEIVKKYDGNAQKVNEELDKLTEEYESKGNIVSGCYFLKNPSGSKMQFLKKDPPRYVLFSFRDKGERASKKVVRFSESWGNSHLGIAGGLIGELNKYLGLSVEDIKLYQSHHNEEPTIVRNEDLEVKVGGGGFIYFEPKDKEILLSGKSKTFDLHSGEYAIEHQSKVHNDAKRIIENWLQSKGTESYRVKIV